MGAKYFSEMWVFTYKAARCHNPEDYSVNNQPWKAQNVYHRQFNSNLPLVYQLVGLFIVELNGKTIMYNKFEWIR
jgi:hypothetical protein